MSMKRLVIATMRKKIRSILQVIFICFSLWLVACTAEKNGDIEPQTSLQPSRTPLPILITPIPSPTVTPSPLSVTLASPTIVLTAADIPTPTELTISLEPKLIATIQPHSDPNSRLPENVWWSEDSQTLFYQDIEARQAWAYDLSTQITTPIDYEPRSFRELAPQIEATLPENARLFSLSPSGQYILYRIRLPEPIPFPENPNNEYPLPPYNYELWLRKDNQDFLLGLVDSSFGAVSPPIWSANENVAVVNAAGAPGIPYIYASWLIDLETLSVGGLDTPWEGVVHFYSVRDLSADGNLLIVRANSNYFYERTTGEQWPIPGANTDNIFLIEGESPKCLVLEAEVLNTILRTHLWYCEPVIGKTALIATIEGPVGRHAISPNERFIVFIVTNIFGTQYRNIQEGIWLVTLP